MRRRHLLAAMIALTLTGPAAAEPIGLTAAEIEALLAGNTGSGLWQGDPYRQHFAVDGSTIYSPKNSRSTLGKWRMNAETNEYESWWERSGWSAYGIVRDGG